MSQQKTLIDQYRDHLARIGKSAHTVKAYNRDVGALALWWARSTGQEFDPKVVDTRDSQEYRGYLVRKRRAPATINRRLIALRRFFHWANERGWLQTVPSKSWRACWSSNRKTLLRIG